MKTYFVTLRNTNTDERFVVVVTALSRYTASVEALAKGRKECRNCELEVYELTQV